MIPIKHVTLQQTYSDAKPQIEDNFNRISTGAVHGRHFSYELSDSKMMSHWEDTTLTVQVYASQLAAGWPAATYVDIVPQVLTNPAYRYFTDAKWVCTDPGAGTGTVELREMEWAEATPAWTSVNTIASWTLTQSGKGGATNPSSGLCAENGTSLLGYLVGRKPAIGLYANVGDATALTSQGSFLRVQMRFKQHLGST